MEKDANLTFLLRQHMTQKMLDENIKHRPTLWRPYAKYRHLLPK